MHYQCRDWHFSSPCAKEASLRTAPWDNILQHVATKLYVLKFMQFSQKRIGERESPRLLMMRHAAKVTFLHASWCHLCSVLVLLLLLKLFIKLASLEKRDQQLF